MFIGFFIKFFIQGLLGFNLWFLGVYKVQETTKEEFVINVI
jgi:hypothetical protein